MFEEEDEIQEIDMFDNQEVQPVTEATKEEDTKEVESTEEDKEVQETTETNEPEKEETDDSTTSTENESEDTKKEEEVKIDYEAEYKKLLNFKADGQDIELNDVSELVSLAQKGVNYTRKTKELAKNNKYIKTLKDNDLLSDDKINFIIDLHKGDKKAITKHLKELSVDPIELDVDAESNYEQVNYIPDERSLYNQDIIDRLYNQPEGKAVIDDINNWDEASITKISKDLSQLQLLTEHKKLGYYDIITKEIQKQELIGNLDGISYFDAYASIGNNLTKQGKLGKPNPSESKVVDVKKAITTIKSDKANLNKLSPLSSSSKTKEEINTSEMNDEEFRKYMKKQYNI